MNRFVFLLVCLLITGCSTHLNNPPRVTLADMTIGDVTVFETTVEVKLRIANRSPEPLSIRGGRFDISLNGIELGEGLSRDSVTIPGLDSRELVVPFQVSNLTFIRRIQRLVEASRFEYSLDGKLFGTGFYDYSVEENNLIWDSNVDSRPARYDRYGTL
ncbi:MAG: LEA type 2 family protein [Bdellovibrionales bacterium]|nr:LEA type 2 family protein [Bdellovibrionales bacterium]